MNSPSRESVLQQPYEYQECESGGECKLSALPSVFFEGSFFGKQTITGYGSVCAKCRTVWIIKAKPFQEGFVQVWVKTTEKR